MIEGANGGAPQAELEKNVEKIDRLRQADFDKMVREENTDGLRAYFINPDNIRTWGLSSFNRAGNVLTFATEDKSGQKSLCLLNKSGETKFYKFGDFVSLVKSNNKRESGGGFLNKAKETLSKINNLPEKLMKNTENRFDKKKAAIEEKLGIKDLSESALEEYLLNYIENFTDAATDQVKVKMMTALILNNKIGMGGRIFTQSKLFKEYGVDLHELADIKAHYREKEYRGDHKEKFGFESMERAAKVLAKKVSDMLIRRVSPLSLGLDADGRRTIDATAKERKVAKTKIDEIVKRLGGGAEDAGAGLAGFSRYAEAEKIVEKFGFKWQDLLFANTGGRTATEYAGYGLGLIVPDVILKPAKMAFFLNSFRH